MRTSFLAIPALLALTSALPSPQPSSALHPAPASDKLLNSRLAARGAHISPEWAHISNQEETALLALKAIESIFDSPEEVEEWLASISSSKVAASSTKRKSSTSTSSTKTSAATAAGAAATTTPASRVAATTTPVSSARPVATSTTDDYECDFEYEVIDEDGNIMEFDTRTGCPALDSSGDIIVRPDGNPVLFDSDGNKIVTSPSSGSSGDVVDGEEEIDRLIDSVSEVDGDRTASAGDEEEEGTGTMEHVIDNTDEDDVATPAVIEEVHVEGNIRLPKLKTHHDSVASNSNTAHKYNLIPKHKAAVVVEDEPVSHTYTLKPKHKAVSAHATRPTFKKVNGHWVKVKPAPEPVDGSHPDLFSHVN